MGITEDSGSDFALDNDCFVCVYFTKKKINMQNSKTCSVYLKNNPLCEIALGLFQINPIQMDDDGHFICAMVNNRRLSPRRVSFTVSELL